MLSYPVPKTPQPCLLVSYFVYTWPCPAMSASLTPHFLELAVRQICIWATLQKHLSVSFPICCSPSMLPSFFLVYQKNVCSRISCCKLFCSGRDSVQVLSVRFFQNSQITWEHIGSLWSCFLFLRFLVFLLRLNCLQKNPASLQLLFQVKYDSPSSGITRNTVASTFYLIFWSADIVTFIFEQLRLL